MVSPSKSGPPKKEPPKLKFTGKLQPCVSRVPEIPPVAYDQGGDDFRCPSLRQTSSFGRQFLSGGRGKCEPRIPFRQSSRFSNSATLGPGPANLRQTSSLNRQGDSRKVSAASTSFGTSSRDGALRLYAVYTTKK
jgi:hypothetical protein